MRTDSAALRACLWHFEKRRLLDAGCSEIDAKRRAKTYATGPLFRTRKALLARLRAAARKLSA